MKNWPNKKELFLVLFVLLILAAVAFIAIAALLDKNDSLQSLSTALSSIVAIIIGLVSISPTLNSWLRPKEQLSDEQVKNAFEQLKMARQCLKDENFEKAVENASEVISKLPKQADAYRIRAQSHAKLGNIPSALEDYNRAIELEPGYPFVHCFRASLLQQMGEYEKAIPDMLKCLALAPELPSQFHQMAETLFVVGEFDKAERIYQKVLDHPRTPEKEKEMAQENLQRIANMRQIQEEFDETSLKIRRSM